MSPILAAVLLFGGLLGAATVAIATPLLFVLVVYDLSESHEKAPEQAKDAPLRIAVERGVARGFVLLGGAFWSIASFAGLYTYRQTGWGAALLAGFYPMIACAATLVVGWYFERFTAAALALASLAVVAWGVVFQFELGVWMLMTFALIGPMMTAAVLFWLARREQEAFELEWSFAPQLALVFSARSSIAV